MNSLNKPGRIPWQGADSAPQSNRSLVLTTWKEIARYMGKGVRTVQRWEWDFGLPVRRPSGSGNKCSVLVFAADLDAWIAFHCSTMRRDPGTDRDQLPCATLRQHMQTATELHMANRLLLNEIRIAVEALQRRLSAMCPPSGLDGRELGLDQRIHSGDWPN